MNYLFIYSMHHLARLLGRSAAPRYQWDEPGWDGSEHIKRFVLEQSSGLYSRLCAQVSGDCVYPSVVKLTENTSCQGLECNVDTLRVVQVDDVFYEYVRRPCVEFAFYENAKTVFAGTSSNGASMCANMDLPVASKTCCPSGASSDATIDCHYHGELVRYKSNEIFCGDTTNVCPGETNRVSDQDHCRGQNKYSSNIPKTNHFHWTSGSCTINIKVRLDGMVALVHKPESATKVVKYVQNSVGNMNFFRVSYYRGAVLLSFCRYTSS